MSLKTSFFILLLFSVSLCNAQQNVLLDNDLLKIEELKPGVYLQISYLQTEDFGKVGCNGLIYVNNGEAAVFDTPANEEASEELLDFIEKTLKAKTVAVIINHFHDDCLGGLNAFHQRGIPSYATSLTAYLAKKEENNIPQQVFSDSLNLKIGNGFVQNTFFGAGHTYDNIVSYLPAEKVLFGGCMVKEVGASNGYTGDADMTQWSKTIQKVKAHYPGVEIVVPGHGKTGGTALLDYTSTLFKVP